MTLELKQYRQDLVMYKVVTIIVILKLLNRVYCVYIGDLLQF